MASASSEPVATGVVTESERVASLEAALARERRRREAAEQWGEFLERELEARDRRLESVIDQYEAQIEGIQRQAEVSNEGLWARLTDRVDGLLPGR